MPFVPTVDERRRGSAPIDNGDGRIPKNKSVVYGFDHGFQYIVSIIVNIMYSSCVRQSNYIRAGLSVANGRSAVIRNSEVFKIVPNGS